MPQGCATWPAAWETSENNWPNLGEVDIVGTNLVSDWLIFRSQNHC